MMTKRHFQQFADMLNVSQEHCSVYPEASPLSIVKHIAIELADICQRDNPRFDRAHFMKACGL